MFGLILILALLIVGISVLLAAITVVLTGYLYSRPTEGITWRAPVAGVIVGLFFIFWCWLESRTPGRFDSLLNFTPRETLTFDQFWSERHGESGKKEILFKRGKDNRGRVLYRDEDGRPWQRSDNGVMRALIVEENGERVRFEAEMNSDGTFRIDSNQPLRYVEKGGRGRVMTENMPGEVTATRYGLLFGNLLLNLAHLAVWFAVLAFLLDFQWPHALVLAILLWLLFALAIWPVLQGQVGKAMAARPLPAASARAILRPTAA